MTAEGINLSKAIEDAKKALEKEENLSPSFVATVELLIVIITILINKLGLNSSNSSKPPSTDSNSNPKKKKKKKTEKKPGGQKGHKGSRLEPVENPDEIVELSLDKKSLPKGNYTTGKSIKRQVFDITINKIVTEYQAQVLIDKNGNQFTANFPGGVDHPTQYGANIKAHVVYDSQVQLIPTKRIVDDFSENFNLPISQGFVHNCIKKAYNLLEDFELAAKAALTDSKVLNVDETGINVNGSNIWLHGASNEKWTLFMPHNKRGKEAMDDMGIIPAYQGILCHDHWKPYLSYDCKHSLCNAHHIRELERAFEQDDCKWAEKIRDLLFEVNKNKIDSDGNIPEKLQDKFRMRFQKILKDGEVETPPPIRPPGKKKRGRLKRTKARNLLERLIKYEVETLRFMVEPDVPFTNNLSERDIRMTKVQQKISGCFRSFDGATYFARIRSFISTSRKQGLSPAITLKNLFLGEMPGFVENQLNDTP